jgi:hypothetical protein
MSDKHFQSMMADQVDRQLQREWQQNYSNQAVRNFSRPAYTCALCGKSMAQDPESGKAYQMDKWERQWSVHRGCSNKAFQKLDTEDNQSGR